MNKHIGFGIVFGVIGLASVQAVAVEPIRHEENRVTQNKLNKLPSLDMVIPPIETTVQTQESAVKIIQEPAATVAENPTVVKAVKPSKPKVLTPSAVIVPKPVRQAAPKKELVDDARSMAELLPSKETLKPLISPEPNAAELKAVAPKTVPSLQHNAQIVPSTQAVNTGAADLSPKTKNLLSGITAGVGKKDEKIVHISMEKGGFAPGALDGDAAIVGENFQEIEKTAAEGGFELDVATGKAPKEEDYELLSQAEKAIKVAQYESAIVLYKKVLAKTPKHREAMFGLATAYHKAGRKNTAKEEYGNLLKLYPKYEPALNNLLALAAEEAPQKAMVEFSRIEAQNPEFSAVYVRKAALYRANGDYVSARKNMAKALQLEPDNQTYRYDLAIIEDESQNYRMAAKLYSDLIEAANNNIPIPADKQVIVERMNYISTLR